MPTRVREDAIVGWGGFAVQASEHGAPRAGTPGRLWERGESGDDGNALGAGQRAALFYRDPSPAEG